MDERLAVFWLLEEWNIIKARNRLRSGFGLLVSAGRIFVRLMPQSDLAAAHTAWKALLPSERRVDYGQTARFTASHGLRAVYIAFGFAPGPPAAGRGQEGQERGKKVIIWQKTHESSLVPGKVR